MTKAIYRISVEPHDDNVCYRAVDVLLAGCAKHHEEITFGSVMARVIDDGTAIELTYQFAEPSSAAEGEGGTDGDQG